MRTENVQWTYSSVAEELVAVNLQKLHGACARRPAQSGLEVGLNEVGNDVNSEIAHINTAVFASHFEVALDHYLCLCSLLYTIVPLGSTVIEPATFTLIKERDAAYMASSRAHWLSPPVTYDTSDFWVEHAIGSAGYLGKRTVNEIMRMQRAPWLSLYSSSNIVVEFCFAQTYVSMEHGLRMHEFYQSTVERLQHGNAPRVHSEHGHTCIALHRGLMEAKFLVIPIVGDNHFKVLLVHPRARTLFWHDPYGNGNIHEPIKGWLPVWSKSHVLS